MDVSTPVDSASVFLNVPYDKGYEPLLITLVGAFVCLGLKPRCVLEIQETGQGRLERIQALLESCRASVHDLSRVGTPVRFNMPFELGLACNLARYRGNHDIIVLEKQPFRLDRTLSDLKGRDPLVHEGKCGALVGCVLDAFETGEGNPEAAAVRRVTRRLRRVASTIRQKTLAETVFRRSVFQRLVSAAVELAVDDGLIEP